MSNQSGSHKSELKSKMVGLDTSVVLRLITGEPLDLARVAIDFLLKFQKEGGVGLVSDLVVSETYFALQHHYQVPKVEALNTLRRFLSTEGIKPWGEAQRILEIPTLESSKPGFIDRIIHQNYLQQAESVATFETSAKKLSNAMVLKVSPSDD